MKRYILILALSLMLSLPLAAQETPELEPITAANMDRLTVLYNLDLGEGEIQELLFSPDEMHLALLLKQQSHVDILEAYTGLIVARLGVRQATLLDLDFSPDGRLLAAIGDDGNIYVWNAKTSEQLLILRGHDGLDVRVIFSPDGTIIASSDGDKAQLWELATGELLTEIMLPSSIVDITFSPDGNLLAVLDANVHVELWDITTLTQFLSFDATDYTNDPQPFNMAFSPNGRFIIVADSMESGHIWDTSQTPPVASRLPDLRYTEIIDRGQYIRLLPYLTEEEKIQIIDIQTQDILTIFEFMSTRELPETFNPDETIYVTENSAIVLWAIATGAVVWDSNYDSALFSPSSTYLASWNTMNEPVLIVVTGVARSSN